MKLRALTASEVRFSIRAEYDDIPVRGNAQVSDDPADDRAVENWIIERLNSGDVWAWALVCVSARWGSFVGVDYLGACCYESEADFVASGDYYPDMCAEALKDLNAKIAAAAAAIAPLVLPEVQS